jgi:hypothetical protein
VILFTATGANVSGQDDTGIFGTPWALSGPYLVSIVFDSLGGESDGDPGVWEGRFGGRLFPLPSPVLSASLTINGVTVALPTVTYTNVRAFDGQKTLNVAQDDTSFYRSLNFNLSDSQFTNRLDQVITGIGGNGIGAFYWGPHIGPGAYGNFGAGTVSFELDAAAVPESASWALLIAGFGLTGAAMRRRRVSALAA